MKSWPLAVAALVCVRVAAAEGPAAPDTAPSTVAVVETEARGVDPVVGRIANRRLLAVIEVLGYSPLEIGVAREAMQRLGIAYPPTIADQWRLTYALGATHGVFAVVTASGGRYQLEVRIASRDGSGPRHARGDADATSFNSTLEALVRQALPVPAPAPEPVAPRPQSASPITADRAPVLAPAPAASETNSPRTPALDVPPASGAVETASVSRSARRLRYALRSESAIGIANDPFYLHLIGGRLDLRFSREFALGALAAYANLPGRDGRVASVLTALELEQRLGLDDAGDFAIPLRLALGYLWSNGPVLRVGPGFVLPLGDCADLQFDLAAPTFWVTPERTLLSLDFAVEIAWTP